MSFEGYYQYVCPNGHSWEVDSMTVSYDDEGKRAHICPTCLEETGATVEAAWTNLVDDTNCNAYGTVMLEPDWERYSPGEASAMKLMGRRCEFVRIPKPDVQKWMRENDASTPWVPVPTDEEWKKMMDEANAEWKAANPDA